eukprot:4380347-Prymnesium_polylepis.1
MSCGIGTASKLRRACRAARGRARGRATTAVAVVTTCVFEMVGARGVRGRACAPAEAAASHPKRPKIAHPRRSRHTRTTHPAYTRARAAHLGGERAHEQRLACAGRAVQQHTARAREAQGRTEARRGERPHDQLLEARLDRLEAAHVRPPAG